MQKKCLCHLNTLTFITLNEIKEYYKRKKGYHAKPDARYSRNFLQKVPSYRDFRNTDKLPFIMDFDFG